MYAIVKTGGKQYRVEQGQWLLVERLPAVDGAIVELQPLLLVDGDQVVDGDGLAGAVVAARVLAHERGPKLRVVKFKPKRGYKRRTGHRQNLTRLEVTEIAFTGRQGSADDVASGAAEGVDAGARPPMPVAAQGAVAADAGEGAGGFDGREVQEGAGAFVAPVGEAGEGPAGEAGEALAGEAPAGEAGEALAGEAPAGEVPAAGAGEGPAGEVGETRDPEVDDGA